MQCKSLWIKASAKCINVNVNVKLLEEGTDLTLARTLEIAAQCERVELQIAALHVSSDSEIKETVSLVSKKGVREHKKTYAIQ